MKHVAFPFLSIIILTMFSLSSLLDQSGIQFLYSPCCFFFPRGRWLRENGDLIFNRSLSASSSSSYLSSSLSSSASLLWGLEAWDPEGDGGTEEGLGYLNPSVCQSQKKTWNIRRTSWFFSEVNTWHVHLIKSQLDIFCGLFRGY